MIYYKDAIDSALEEIRGACENVLAVFELTWKFVVSPPIMNTWEITFFESGKPRCLVRFFRPPGADVRWYELEIGKQIKERLMAE